MAQYDNTNTFVLFKNDQGDNPKRMRVIVTGKQGILS